MSDMNSKHMSVCLMDHFNIFKLFYMLTLDSGWGSTSFCSLFFILLWWSGCLVISVSTVKLLKTWSIPKIRYTLFALVDKKVRDMNEFQNEWLWMGIEARQEEQDNKNSEKVSGRGEKYRQQCLCTGSSGRRVRKFGAGNPSASSILFLFWEGSASLNASGQVTSTGQTSSPCLKGTDGEVWLLRTAKEGRAY